MHRMALLAALASSFFGSATARTGRIDEVAADVEAFRKTPRVEAGLSLEAIVPRLESVKRVSDSANRFSDGAWSMRWGLFQGNSLGNAARDAYSRELAGALPQVASRIEQRMVACASEPLKMCVLKAYLMLGDPSRMVKPQFAFIADREWKAAYRPILISGRRWPVTSNAARQRRPAAPDAARSDARSPGARHHRRRLDS